MAAPVPHTAFVAEAKHAEVTRLVREVLQERGARFDEQTPSRTVFEDLVVPGGFRRGGYVGTYQPIGDKGVEVLVQVWATGPRRAWWGVVLLVLVAVPALLLASPPSAVFFLAGIALWALLVLAGVMYYLTFRVSGGLEDELYAAVLAHLRRGDLVALDEEQQLERRIREQLEGEVKERELAERPPPPPKPRLGRRGEAGPRKPGLFRRGQP